MGAVYVVDQLSTGKARALKVMKPEIAQDADGRRRFELEARVGARIESDHVVEIHSAGVDDGTPYIVMELLDGEDLGSRMTRGPLSASEVREVLEQLCHAVAAAHAADIVHRDLKPENVFLARTKRAGGDARVVVKVLDFGIAKHVAESATRGQTVGMIGTPMWMAPEQTEPGKTTPAADVWALGLILYYVTTGHLYWLAAENPEATLTQLLKEVVMGPLPMASTRAHAQGAPRIAPELDAVIARCLVRDPKQRFANAQLLWEALSTALAPPSVRIVADAGAGPGGATIAAAPASLPNDTGVSAPVVALPPFQAASFHHGAGMSTPAPLWKRLWPIPVVLVSMVVAQQCVASVRRPREEQEPSKEDRLSGFTVTPPVGATARQGERPSACRLCTTGLTVSGAVPRESFQPVFDGAYPVFDQQCLGARRGKRPSAAIVTYAFVVRDGRATNRRIERSSSSDGTDECLLRAFADLAFPSSPDETQVTVTLAFNAALAR